MTILLRDMLKAGGHSLVELFIFPLHGVGQDRGLVLAGVLTLDAGHVLVHHTLGLPWRGGRLGGRILTLALGLLGCATQMRRVARRVHLVELLAAAIRVKVLPDFGPTLGAEPRGRCHLSPSVGLADGAWRLRRRVVVPRQDRLLRGILRVLQDLREIVVTSVLSRRMVVEIFPGDA